MNRHVVEMTRIWRGLAVVAAIVVLGVPVAFVMTIALLPLWSAIERRYGIESVGHSGPADWCFWLVFVIYLGAAWAVARPFRVHR
jgi:hypothetical protein